MDVNRRVHTGLSLYIFVKIYSRFEIQNIINLNICYAPGD